MTRTINLFAGPGAGKSTIACELFSLMKWNQFDVELVTEFAKDLTWEQHHNLLEDQLFVFANQNRRLARLIGKVDWVVTDSPLALSMIYMPKHYPTSFREFNLDMWKQYNNVNFFINRKKPYHENGRSQSLDQAVDIDDTISRFLFNNEIPFTPIEGDQSAKFTIFEKIQQYQ